MKMTNDKAIELIKDEYCSDCVWKDEREDHCDSCMVGDILNILELAKNILELANEEE